MDLVLESRLDITLDSGRLVVDLQLEIFQLRQNVMLTAVEKPESLHRKW